jgi:dimethylhistidine N-methyltransferase
MTVLAAEGVGAAIVPLGGSEADGFTAVAAAVRAGLARARKRLPPWLLYDQRGSALFEQITELPEYYLTRTERAILARHAGAMIEAAGPPLEIIELGAGSAAKTRLLLEALLERVPRATYVPVDVSPTALRMAASQLRGLQRLNVRPVVARYPEALGFLRGRSRSDRALAAPSPVRRLVLFLGSNIGNYDPPAARALLAGVRRHLSAGDALLMGVDRRKPPAVVLPAYDDASGVTARFNKNLLARMNRELGARFDLDRFRHVVAWNDRASRVELYLESAVAQRVPIPSLRVELDFAARERIHTESSYKLTDLAVRRLLVRSGFAPEASWYDERPWFGLHLARVPATRPRR